MKFRYFVSYFVKLNVGNDDIGLKMNGHIESGVYEINHPLTTKEEVDHFVKYLQGKQNQMWTVQLLGFSLMYIINPDDRRA